MLCYLLFIQLQEVLNMGKPMGQHPLTHDINPKNPLLGRQACKTREIPRSPLHHFDQRVEVPKLVKYDQCFLKTWSRSNIEASISQVGLH
jgi:hypothetical protein